MEPIITNRLPNQPFAARRQAGPVAARVAAGAVNGPTTWTTAWPFRWETVLLFSVEIRGCDAWNGVRVHRAGWIAE